MNFPCKVDSLDGIDLAGRSLHLAIGMFDGVHLGHQSVIESAVHSARRQDGVAGVLTFHPHPSALFRPEDPTRLIMEPASKTKFFHGLGADLVIEQPFDRKFAAIPADRFPDYLLERLPTLDSIYVGENWRFGRGREGDVAFLIERARPLGISIISMPRLQRNGKPISSSRIRKCLLEGEVEEANSLLGYTYFVEGTVCSGRGMGARLGFPTLNIPWPGDLRPRFGVYGVRAAPADAAGEEAPWGARARRVPGIANFGVRPTVEADATEPVLEVHLLAGESPFGPGDRLRVEWLFFHRPEEKFADLDALKARIVRDCREVRDRFPGGPG